MQRVIIVVALLAVGFVAGTLAPRAQAADAVQEVVRELREIRQEISSIRRAIERQR